MWAIIKRTIQDNIVFVVIYSLVAFGLLILYIAMFPTIQDQAENFGKVIQSFPAGFRKAFGVDSIIFTDVSSYVANRAFGFVWPIQMAYLAISLGSSFFAGEIEKGTMVLLLSQPVSRLKIFLAKYLSGVVLMVIFIFFSVLAVAPLASFFSLELPASHVLTMGILSFLFGITIFSLTLLFSVLFSEKGKVTIPMMLMLLIMYVVNILATLNDNVAFLQYLSFFYYFQPTEALVNNTIPLETVAVFLGLSFIATFSSAIIFDRRDIAA